MEPAKFKYSSRHPYRFFLQGNYWKVWSDISKTHFFQYKFRDEKTMLMAGKFDSKDVPDEDVDIKTIVLGKGRNRVFVDDALQYDDMAATKPDELLGECSDDWFQTIIAVTKCECRYDAHHCFAQDMEIAANRFFNTMDERHGKEWHEPKTDKSVAFWKWLRMRTKRQELEGELRLKGGNREIQEINQKIEKELEGFNSHIDLKPQRDVSSNHEKSSYEEIEEMKRHIQVRRKFEKTYNDALINSVEPKINSQLEKARKDFIERTRASYKEAIMKMGCGDDSELVKALDKSMRRYATPIAFLRTLAAKQKQHSHSERGGSSQPRLPHDRSDSRSESSSRGRPAIEPRNSGSSPGNSLRSSANSEDRRTQSLPRKSTPSNARHTEQKSDGGKKVLVLTTTLKLPKRRDANSGDSKRGEISLNDKDVKKKPASQHRRERHG